MASSRWITAGAAIRVTARSACNSMCTSGSDWQRVPIRFHMKATASNRSTSTPRLARFSITAAMSRNTAGLAQFRSHWCSLKVVQTHLPMPG